VDPKHRAWLLIVIVAALCGGSVWGIAWYRSRPMSVGTMIRRLPVQDALILYIDFDALRRGGVLQLLEGSKADQDSDYLTFVQKTNFDYRQDLDSAIVAFSPSGKYLLAKGRFDWKSLRSYALSEGGSCQTSICRMAGSTPDRRISFFPMQSNLMALAVSPDESAVIHMTGRPTPGPEPVFPKAPVWVSIPASLLKSPDTLPAGTHIFARSVQQADNVTLAFIPDGGRFAANLEVQCRNEQDALTVASQLASSTVTLRQMLEREHQKPGPGDLAGVLASGNFRNEGRRVFGYWPIDRAFVENILRGGVS